MFEHKKSIATTDFVSKVNSKDVPPSSEYQELNTEDHNRYGLIFESVIGERFNNGQVPLNRSVIQNQCNTN